MQDYAGKIAVIRGTGSGIGKATAKLLSARGARVIGAELSNAAGQQTADEISALCQLRFSGNGAESFPYYLVGEGQ